MLLLGTLQVLHETFEDKRVSELPFPPDTLVYSTYLGDHDGEVLKESLWGGAGECFFIR